ncbi:MAG TPA: hypothetical protein VGS97_22530 [Actinocrinis sp.]|uniref:hypothetical protein n=1 Tax=Actinocrinis sp. TaxID=1920516 RepID=UPI002DDCD1D6|nr:hypothetical protein [Actinocrinis sp.]HEV2346896.1 hypothetical protein [Actinocrinis sp.]
MVHFSCSANGSGPTWTMHVEGREAVRWPILSTGPVVLSDSRLEQFAERLLGVRLAEVPDLAARAVRYPQGSDGNASALVLHGATSAKRDFECAVTDLLAGRAPTDMSGFLETRAVALAGPDDLVVGRIASWREAVRFFGVQALDLLDTDHYYLTHAVLDQVSRETAASTRLLDWVSAHPDCVVRPYVFDLETQLLLLWLVRRLGLPHLTVDANAPSVSTYWNQKSHLHPETSFAAALAVEGFSAQRTLDLEYSYSPMAEQLHIELPTVPGYTVVREARTEREFTADMCTAGRLLRERYGLLRGCLKPSQGGGGAGIVSGLVLADEHGLAAAAQAAYPHGGDYVLEADVDLFRFDVAGSAQKLSPSGHIRGGQVATGMTAQFVDGHAWVGNVYFDSATAAQFGIAPELYDLMRSAIGELHRGLSAGQPAGSGFVTGGVDFVVGRLGGRFGDRPVAAAVDLNLSHHGGEYLRAFLEESVPAGRYAATRVFRPSADANLADTASELSRSIPERERTRLIGVIPDDWGMLAATGDTPLDAARRVFMLVERLQSTGLALV